MTIDTIIIFIHILAASIVLGGETYLQFFVSPLLTKEKKKIKTDDKIVLLYDITLPCTFFFAGVILITGILTVFKQYSYLKNVSESTLAMLGVKVAFSVVIVGISSYQTFSLRMRIKGLSPFSGEEEDIKPVVQKVKTLSVIIICLISCAMILGLTIG